MTSPWTAVSGSPQRTTHSKNDGGRCGLSTATAVHARARERRLIRSETEFLEALCLERRRSERSGLHFLLVLFESTDLREASFAEIGAALAESIRETDVSGWFRHGRALGVIFTELRGETLSSALAVLSGRISVVLHSRLEPGDAERVETSFHLFPEDTSVESGDAALHPELVSAKSVKGPAQLAKRALDIVGSAAGLLLFAPLFGLIAIAIKLGSPGPVFYRQVRVGQAGRRFTFLKFRSMHVNCASTTHRDFVTRFIRGEEADGGHPDRKVFKLTRDPRVTPLGEILRKTSLDELPQLINVLKGEMSLVGPRPPIPYELEAYHVWHYRRVLEVKPGLTGLWQVSGRSRTSFDEMVRLDLRYASRQSFWTDLCILARTPWAVLSGKGAY